MRVTPGRALQISLLQRDAKTRQRRTVKSAVPVGILEV